MEPFLQVYYFWFGLEMVNEMLRIHRTLKYPSNDKGQGTIADRSFLFSSWMEIFIMQSLLLTRLLWWPQSILSGQSALTCVKRFQELLLKFRAGKMVMEGSRVHADPRKGLVRIVRVRFLWSSSFDVKIELFASYHIGKSLHCLQFWAYFYLKQHYFNEVKSSMCP
jgi:hypothetical protein